MMATGPARTLRPPRVATGRGARGSLASGWRPAAARWRLRLRASSPSMAMAPRWRQRRQRSKLTLPLPLSSPLPAVRGARPRQWRRRPGPAASSELGCLCGVSRRTEEGGREGARRLFRETIVAPSSGHYLTHHCFQDEHDARAATAPIRRAGGKEEREGAGARRRNRAFGRPAADDGPARARSHAGSLQRD